MKKTITRIWQTYSLKGLIRIVIDVIITKFNFPNARIIRSPFYFRGQQYMSIGNQFTSGVGLRLDCFPVNNKVCLDIGINVQVNDYVHIGAINLVKIGNHVLIASKVFITDHNHGYYGFEGIHTCPNIPPVERDLSSAPVIIEDNVWIGEFVTVLPGVTIGRGSIIGANSVVSKNVPPYCIAFGVPAKIFKMYNFNNNQWEIV